MVDISLPLSPPATDYPSPPDRGSEPETPAAHQPVPPIPQDETAASQPSGPAADQQSVPAAAQQSVPAMPQIAAPGMQVLLSTPPIHRPSSAVTEGSALLPHHYLRTPTTPWDPPMPSHILGRTASDEVR